MVDGGKLFEPQRKADESKAGFGLWEKQSKPPWAVGFAAAHNCA